MSSFALKILGIILMTVDHIGLMFVEQDYIFRAIGRIAFPIFAFQITQGFKHTKNKENYILKLLIFTIISQLPYWLFLKTAIPTIPFSLNVGGTLTLGALCLYVIEKIQYLPLRVILVPLLILIGFFIPIDYGWFGITMIVLFYLFENNVVLLSTSLFFIVIIYCITRLSIFELPVLLALLPIFAYNQKQGPKVKYLFYIFYPLHLLILTVIKLLIV